MERTIHEFVKKYPGKTLEQIVELELQAEQEIKVARKREDEAEQALLKEILDHKYFKIDFNGASISFVEVTEINQRKGIMAYEINRVINGTNVYLKVEEKRQLNLLWFKSQGAVIEKITKEQYDQAVSLVDQVKELVKSVIF